MRLVVMQFMSLDGVTQGPGSPDEDPADGFTAGGWLVPHIDETFVRTVEEWTLPAEAFLFGRFTYLNFARDWPAMPDLEDPVALALNGRPKFVASNTLHEATWDPTTILSGDVLGAVAELRARPGGELQVHGSTRLSRSLLDAGLVDELRLVTAPVVVGSGRRLFEPGRTPTSLRLDRTTTTPGGLVMATYVPTGAPETGTYTQAEHSFRDQPT